MGWTILAAGLATIAFGAITWKENQSLRAEIPFLPVIATLLCGTVTIVLMGCWVIARFF